MPEYQNLVVEYQKKLYTSPYRPFLEDKLGPVAFKNIELAMRSIRPELLDCDYYRMLDGDVNAVNSFRGEYMKQYTWAELTAGRLYFRGNSSHE